MEVLPNYAVLIYRGLALARLRGCGDLLFGCGVVALITLGVLSATTRCDERGERASEDNHISTILHTLSNIKYTRTKITLFCRVITYRSAFLFKTSLNNYTKHQISTPYNQ